ncbi:hypothetical protein [Streptomyces sp. NPDC051776]
MRRDDVVAAAMIDRLVRHAEVPTNQRLRCTRQLRELLARENRRHRD